MPLRDFHTNTTVRNKQPVDNDAQLVETQIGREICPDELSGLKYRTAFRITSLYV